MIDLQIMPRIMRTNAAPIATPMMIDSTECVLAGLLAAVEIVGCMELVELLAVVEPNKNTEVIIELQLSDVIIKK